MKLGSNDQLNPDLFSIYKEALGAAHIGVWHWDILNRKMSFDEGILNIYEFPNYDDFSDIESWFKFLAPDDLSHSRAFFQSAIQTDLEVDHQFRIRTFNNKQKIIRTKAKKIRDTNGQVIGLLGVNWDVTIEVEKKKEKQFFDQNFKLMLSLVDQSEDIFGFTDSTGIPIYVNKTGREDFGIQTGSEGKYFTEYLHLEDQKKIKQDIVPQLRKGLGWEGEIRFLQQKMNEIIPMWFRIFCVRSEDISGQMFYCCLGINLKKIKTLQSVLMQQSKLATLGEITSGIAHEVNNPLSIIVGKTSLLATKLSQEKYDSMKALEYLKSIERNADRITKIIRSLNAFSRNSLNDPFAKIALLKIADNAFEIVTEKFKRECIDFCIIIDEKISYENKVEVRESEILQVLINVLNNAYDAVVSLPIKWIKLSINEKQNYYEISVIDSGPGIAPDLQLRIMEPFFTTKPTGQGTGLGLSLSSEIMKSHDGDLSYDHKAMNTTFIIRLKKKIK